MMDEAEVNRLFRVADDLYDKASEKGSATLEARARRAEVRWLKARAELVDVLWRGVNHTAENCKGECSRHNGLD
jgi:hypothetical protein